MQIPNNLPPATPQGCKLEDSDVKIVPDDYLTDEQADRVLKALKESEDPNRPDPPKAA